MPLFEWYIHVSFKSNKLINAEINSEQEARAQQPNGRGV
jgi:hypothetical protein